MPVQVTVVRVGEKTAMSLESEECSLRRARLLTLIVLIVVTAAIVLANLSSEPMTIDLLTRTLSTKNIERDYGWPVTWYWRSRIPGTRATMWASQWPVSRYSLSFLMANLAMWLVMLAATSVACEWLLRRYRPRFHWRPQVTTLFVVMIVSAPTVLANLSCDALPEQSGDASYGWPLIWYRRIVWGYFPQMDWDFSAAALAGNLVIWLLLLAVTTLALKCLFRRNRLRLHFSLRTMLVGVALVAMVCAWCAFLRSRALEQDAVIARLGGERAVYFKRWGPKWLDVVGADRFRRRIVGARVDAVTVMDGVFEQLARLPGLCFLDINPYLYNEPFVFTPGMAAALSEMRQLRMLNVNCTGDDLAESRAATHECLVSIGQLTQLERLRVSMWDKSSVDLMFLANLTRLKTFTLAIRPFDGPADEDSEESESDGEPRVRMHLDRTEKDADENESDGEPRTLAHFPVLPQLEVLDLHEWELGDHDLGRLAGFQRLKSLDLSYTSINDAGLTKLAQLESLEELAIDEYMATAAGFESLLALKRLRAVHISGPASNRTDEIKEEKLIRRAESITGHSANAETLRPTMLALDDARELVVLSSEFDGLRRALRALRQSNPGLVIDARYREFAEKGNLEPPWTNRSRIHSFMRRLLYEPEPATIGRR
jgi:hypothetical protein